MHSCTTREEETKAETGEGIKAAIGEEEGTTLNGEAGECRAGEEWACREEVCKDSSKIPSTTPTNNGDRVESRCPSGTTKITYSCLPFNSTPSAKNVTAQEPFRKEEPQFPVETATGSKEFVPNAMEEGSTTRTENLAINVKKGNGTRRREGEVIAVAPVRMGSGEKDMEARAGKDLEEEDMGDRDMADREDRDMEDREDLDTEDKDSEGSRDHQGTVASIRVASEVLSSKDGDL